MIYAEQLQRSMPIVNLIKNKKTAVLSRCAGASIPLGAKYAYSLIYSFTSRHYVLWFCARCLWSSWRAKPLHGGSYGVVAHAAVVKSSSDFTPGCCPIIKSVRLPHLHHRERRLPPCRRALLEFSRVRLSEA